MIEINLLNVTKSYDKGLKKHYVFSNVTHHLTSDKIHFLVGANGTGKSTLIKCILNLTNYDGKIELSSRKISYAPEKLLMPDYLTVNQFLTSLLIAKHQKKTDINNKINKYLNLFAISEYQNTNLIKLSKGTKQKVNLLQALLDNSDVYIFDEPLSGLDLKSKEVFKKEIYNLKKQKKLVIISTHHLVDYHYRNKNIISMGGTEC